MRRPALLLIGLLAVAGCSVTHPAPSANDMAGMGDMPGMAAAPTATPIGEATPNGTGLDTRVDGYSLAGATAMVPSRPAMFAFRVDGPDGHAVMRYHPYQSRLLLVDVVRSDLTQYRLLDAAMRQDGTWHVALPALPAGSYRAYVTFAAPDSSVGKPLVYQLSTPFTVRGPGSRTALPAPMATASVGGYDVTLSGQLASGAPTTLTMGFTKNGKPVPYFQRYLDGYAHVTAVRAGNMAFAHLTPAVRASGRAGTSALTTKALFPMPGTWRVFVRFQTTGPVLTAAFTVEVR